MGTKDVAIIGAGKIGRGYLSDLFGDANYHLVFINGSTNTIDRLNAAGSYTIFTSGLSGTTEKVVTGFEAYSSDRDFDTVVKRLNEVDIICVALYPGAYPSVADQLAGVISLRAKEGSAKPMNVFFFVNKVFTARTMRKLITERLTTDAEQEYLAKNVGLVESLTHRGGYSPTPEMLEKDPLCVATSEGRVLPVGDNFVGPKPDMKFMEFVDRAEGRLVRKVWCGNMRHCTIAAMGRKRGFIFLRDCAKDQYIRKCVDYAFEEAIFGVGEEFGFTRDEMLESRSRSGWGSMIKTQATDDVFRVAADPLRKLARDDRFIGPALLCLQHGKVPYYLAKGAAYLFFFENEKDPSAVQLQKIVKEMGIEKAIWEVCGLDPADKNDNFLYQMILGAYLDILDHDVNPIDN